MLITGMEKRHLQRKFESTCSAESSWAIRRAMADRSDSREFSNSSTRL